jgi:hypothetical protein
MLAVINYSLASAMPPGVMANVASLSGLSGLKYSTKTCDRKLSQNKIFCKL